MESLTKMFSGATSAVTGAVGANSNKKNNTKVTGLGSNIAPGNTHVNNPGATGGMGTPSQKGGRNKNKNKSNKNKNKNKSNKNKNKNKKNKTRKNRSC
jgi:hypothetical protein